MGLAGSYAKWMSALLLQQWPGPNDDPNDDQPFRNISRNTEEKISCFHTQKRLRLLWDEVLPLAPDPLPGLT